MKTGLIIALAVALLGEYVAPQSDLKAAAFRAQAQGRAITSELRDFWLKNGDEFVYIKRAEPDKRLRGVRIFQVQEGELKRLLKAASAQHTASGWRLNQVREYRFEDDAVSRKVIGQMTKSQLVDVDLFEVAQLSPENMRLLELDNYIAYLDDNRLEATLYRKAFWKKVTAPLSILVMLLLAMPFIFANRRSGNAGARLVIGILFGMSYYIISSLIENLGQVYGVPVLLGAFTPIVAFTGLGFWLLKRSEG